MISKKWMEVEFTSQFNSKNYMVRFQIYFDVQTLLAANC